MIDLTFMGCSLKQKYVNLTFMGCSIKQKHVILYFEHVSFVRTTHKETISIIDARKIIASMAESVKKDNVFYLNDGGHQIEIESLLAKKCIQEFYKIHGTN
jgi:hypothetical protein